MAYLWLRRRARNALTWQAMRNFPLDMLDMALNIRVGARPNNDSSLSRENQELSLKELADMPREQQMNIYLNACKQAGIDVSKLKIT